MTRNNISTPCSSPSRRDSSPDLMMPPATPTTTKDRKRSYKKRNHYNPSLEEIKATFHLPIDEAARKFDICPSKLKRLCRKLGIPRWPYTKKPRYSNEAKQVELLLQQSSEKIVKLEESSSTATSPNASQEATNETSAPSSILASLLAAASSQKMFSGLPSSISEAPSVGKTQKMTELLGNDGLVVFESQKRNGGYSVRNATSSTSLANYAVAKALNYDPSLLLPNLTSQQQTSTTESSSFTQQQSSSSHFERSFPAQADEYGLSGAPYHEQSHLQHEFSSTPSMETSPELLHFFVHYGSPSTPMPMLATPGGYNVTMMQPMATPIPTSFPQYYYLHNEAPTILTPEPSFYPSAPTFASPSPAPRHQAMTPLPNMIMDALAAALQHYQ